ncbi:hypothetical protein BH11ACT8_BH11ACT8_13810 [soil metagenome]
MEQCTRCGHALGVGRFCINCGHPVHLLAPEGDDWRSSTAERARDSLSPPTEVAPARQAPPPPAPPAPPAPTPPGGPAVPPPAYYAPTEARFPLFADEAAPTVVSPAPPIWTGQPAAAPVDEARRRRLLPWVAVATALLLVLVATLGVVLLVRGSDSPESAADPPRAGAGDSSAPGSPDPTPAESATDASPPPSPPATDATPGEPRDVASLATAVPPETAAPSRDVQGNVVRYGGFNMLDGQPDTAWRMPGKGSGRDVMFLLNGTFTLDQVGLINGYAKVSPGYDGYTANRRIKAVQWIFSDGTTVRQNLGEDRGLQTIPVDHVVTDVVTLRILKVTSPAKGPAGRDYTAISDIALVGTPAS